MRAMIFFLLTLCSSTWAVAQESFVQLELGRGDATLPVFVMRQPQATATLLLLPGGDAGIGGIRDGQPGSGNFLARSRSEFTAAGFNVLVLFRPSDLKTLDYGYRISEAHVAEIERAVRYAQQEFHLPVWLVGTSRGTVSAAAAAIALGEGLVSGLVLTSSVTSGAVGAVPRQDLAKIKVPVLVVHHQRDACKICMPSQAGMIVDRLKSAPQRKLVLVDGGSAPEGDPCEAHHWHGFVNYEKETVKLITDWIHNPSN